MHLKTSPAICFKLDQSKILSFGNGLKGDIVTTYGRQKGFNRTNLTGSVRKHYIYIISKYFINSFSVI